MLSLPNSGSTWLAALIAKHAPGCRYYDMEFFNPLRNEKHELILSRRFGCELASCYRNIALGEDDAIDADIDATWGTEDYTFTKEVFCPFKLPVFVRHFRCFALLRSAADSFPPTRLRIWSMYEHAWHALVGAGYDMAAKTVRERAIEAHGVMSSAIRRDAARLRVPIIEFRDLFGSNEALTEVLTRAIGYTSPALVSEIIATRFRRVSV